MVYTILISIVFIAELVILVALITNLLKLDRLILSLDKTVSEAQPGICDISKLSYKISEQCVELAEDWVENYRLKQEDMTLKILNKLLIGLVLWKINSKAIKNFRRSKLGKTIVRGFRLVQNMI